MICFAAWSRVLTDHHFGGQEGVALSKTYGVDYLLEISGFVLLNYFLVSKPSWKSLHVGEDGF